MVWKKGCKNFLIFFTIAALLSFGSSAIHAQQNRMLTASSPQPPETSPEIQVLSELVRDLETQVQTLNSQMADLRTEQQRASAETAELRRELSIEKVHPAAVAAGIDTQYSTPGAKDPAEKIAAAPSQKPPQQLTTIERIDQLEENQEIADARINEQAQTKVESGSKYRLRLSGIVLLNLYENHGQVDNQDFPQVSESPEEQAFFHSSGTFGGSLRQSQIKLQAFGPDLFGARTSADLDFDFAGGFPDQWNGAVMGLVRLRTGTMRLDWFNTSIVAGQDRLFFAPLAPTSIATLAVPALSYAGNLWAWTPQVRVEHHFALSDASNIVLQAGILDNLTGDMPVDQYNRYPSWGELSGQPAYAARIAWSHRIFGQNLTAGAAGYYGRQNWGLSRTFDGWAGTADLTLPLGKQVEFTGAFYRGRAVAGLGGGIGQSVLLNGSFGAATTTFRGLDSMGGWAQLKYKPTTKLEFNTAVGVDNPFADEMRQYKSHAIYPDLYRRNFSPLLNFIYQVRSDVLFSMEYRWLQTSVLDNNANSAGQINMTLGYIF